MKKFDMHVHSFNQPIDQAILLSNMEKAGIYGGCVFSNRPKEIDEDLGTSFEERLKEALAWAKGYEDRIFPVLWIHPYEENILEKLHVAADAGIAAFKIICNNFYVYEEQSLLVLKEIAKLNKPVIFHTGILWDGKVSSDFCRPIHFEALLPITGLRFSMGHCSWPWIDECIALYGKFLNALNSRDTAEMFFDLTPGTPEIYRKELLTKLYTIGYDVGDNLLFGTDSIAHSYRDEWTKNWLTIDGNILDELGVSKANREKLYKDNLLRFLGKTEVNRAKNAPTIDDAKVWRPIEPNVAEIIKKWYTKLQFPKTYDEEFYEALSSIPVSDAITLDRYNLNCKDGKRNLLSFLYFCEKTADYHKRIGIDEKITLDTLRDIVVWTNTWSAVKGELYLQELSWLKRHLSGRLFKLGRLQFYMNNSGEDFSDFGIKKEDNVIEVHIPVGGKLTLTEIENSFSLAREFFAKYFPDYSYEYFTCHSWLLDESLKKYLPETSNILQFGNLFTKVKSEQSDAILRYLFHWNTTAENLAYAYPNTPFAENIKRAFLKGERFFETLGILKK